MCIDTGEFRRVLPEERFSLGQSLVAGGGNRIDGCKSEMLGERHPPVERPSTLLLRPKGRIQSVQAGHRYLEVSRADVRAMRNSGNEDDGCCWMRHMLAAKRTDGIPELRGCVASLNIGIPRAPEVLPVAGGDLDLPRAVLAAPNRSSEALCLDDESQIVQAYDEINLARSQADVRQDYNRSSIT